jgi:RNA-binding protein YlmH
MDIYQHYREDEQPFIDSVLSWKEFVEQSYQPKLTDFLDPREQHMIHMLIGGNNPDIKMHQYGGGAHAERSRVIIAPFYEAIEENDFQLTLLQASFQDKFVSIEHRDVMGAFLSLGIKRKKMGDIFVGSGVIQIVLTTEIADYVMVNLTSIKKASIKLEEVPLIKRLENKTNWIEADKTVSSLRLDNVLKEIYQVSRKDAAVYITKGHVKVNFKVVEDGKFTVQPGDLLSVRGKGRSKLVEVNGQTKKDKWRITTALLK